DGGEPLPDRTGRSSASARAEVESRRVGRLVETDLAAAGQHEGGLDPPGRLGNLAVADTLGCQRFEVGAQVVAHEVEDGSQELSLSMKLSTGFVGGMDGDLGGRERKDQPASTDVDETKSQDVAQEHPVGVRILAVEEDVSAHDHGASLPALMLS